MKAKRILFVFLTHFKTIFSVFYSFPFNNKSIAVTGRKIIVQFVFSTNINFRNFRSCSWILHSGCRLPSFLQTEHITGEVRISPDLCLVNKSPLLPNHSFQGDYNRLASNCMFVNMSRISPICFSNVSALLTSMMSAVYSSSWTLWAGSAMRCQHSQYLSHFGWVLTTQRQGLAAASTTTRNHK